VRRAFVVVLDACGVGALPDAAEYGDAGADTLGHLAHEAGGLELPALGRLGLGSMADVGASVLAWLADGRAAQLPGESFAVAGVRT
jgi:phosphopentomutase